MRLLVKNIGILGGILERPESEAHLPLRGKQMGEFRTMEHAFLLAEDGKIADYGDMSNAPVGADQVIDAQGGSVIPAFCDSHTHLVNSGSREQEFEDRINGLTYAQIAERGGGILNSAKRLHDTSEDQLFEQSMVRIREIIAQGTGAVEIKSGYGLNTDDELKMLRVIRRIAQAAPIPVKATFLGAHAVPARTTQEAYVDEIITDMLPKVARENLAEYVDVFCEQGFFTPEQTDRILTAATTYGLRPKIHAEQLAPSGGVAVAVNHHAISVDHLESMSDQSLELLKNAQNTNPSLQKESPTIPTALPGASFFLNMAYAPARRIIDAGLPLSLASDYNPGSSPSGNMRFVVTLACTQMRLTPAEALNAATINAAAAMQLAATHGSITRGKAANFILTRPIPSLAYIPYAYSTPIIRHTFINGKAEA